jgi:transcription elongation factor Elf1
MLETTTFNCPTCETTYKVVRTEASPSPNERQLLCLSCGAPLRNREGVRAEAFQNGWQKFEMVASQN